MHFFLNPLRVLRCSVRVPTCCETTLMLLAKCTQRQYVCLLCVYNIGESSGSVVCFSYPFWYQERHITLPPATSVISKYIFGLADVHVEIWLAGKKKKM